DNHFFLSSDDENETFFVHPPQVAGVEPSVLYGFGGRLRIMKVSFHQRRRSYQQLTDLARGYFDTLVVDNPDFALRQNPAYRTMFAWSIHGIHRDSRGLSQAIAFQQQALAKTSFKSLRQINGSRRRGDFHEPQAGTFVRNTRRRFQENCKDGR